MGTLQANPHFDFAIIGAGVSGLATALLLAKKNYKVIVLESHSLPGGCASFFKRKGLLFDVGATTLSGFKYNGPLKKFLKSFPVDLNLKHVDPGLCIHFNDKKIYRHALLENWVQELSKSFPNIPKENIESTWRKIDNLNQNAWELTKTSSNYPISNVNDLFGLIGKKSFLKFRSVPYLFKRSIEAFDISDELEYKKLFDELLLISVQNKLDYAPALMASMGLSYLEDTWYSYGGIGEFSRKLKDFGKKEYNIEYQMNNQVLNNQKRNDKFDIQTNTTNIKAKKVISTLPIWNTRKLVSFECKSLNKVVNDHTPYWGAITGYYLIELNENIETLFHQIHHKDGSIFLSFGALDDPLKCKDGLRTLTISTHIKLSEKEKSKNDYDVFFKKYLNSSFKIKRLENIGIGRPSTFTRYTGRERGSVGGIAHDLRKGIFNYPTSNTGVKNFYQVGDTTFPGQGIVGVIQGALNLTSKL